MSAERLLSTEAKSLLLPNKERISSLSFSAPPSPAPGVTHALVIHPPLNHGWEGVVDIMNHGTAGSFFLFAEEGEGRLHCFVP